MEIITARLLLREFVDRDLPALLAYQADPRYAEFWLEEAPSGHGRQLLEPFRCWAAERPRRNYQLASHARVRRTTWWALAGFGVTGAT